MPRGFQFDLDNRDAIDQQQHIVAMVAVIGIYPKLTHHFVIVLAPILDVDQREIERRPVVASETVALAQDFGGGVDIRTHNAIHQSGELPIGESDVIQRLELLPEIGFQRCAIPDIGADDIFESAQLVDELRLNLRFADGGAAGRTGIVGINGVGHSR